MRSSVAWKMSTSDAPARVSSVAGFRFGSWLLSEKIRRSFFTLQTSGPFSLIANLAGMPCVPGATRTRFIAEPSVTLTTATPFERVPVLQVDPGDDRVLTLGQRVGVRAVQRGERGAVFRPGEPAIMLARGLEHASGAEREVGDVQSVARVVRRVDGVGEHRSNFVERKFGDRPDQPI